MSAGLDRSPAVALQSTIAGSGLGTPKVSAVGKGRIAN